MVMQLEDITHDMFLLIKIKSLLFSPLDFTFCVLHAAMICYKYKNTPNFFRSCADINSIFKITKNTNQPVFTY